MYEVKEIGWEDIKPIWETHLWPNKKNGVAKTNEWTWKWTDNFLGKDKEMAKNAHPTFFGIEDDDSIVCVNSVFVTDTGIFTYYRSRGLWVNPEYRKQGLSKLILIHCLEYARSNGGSWVWTVPRQSSLKSYLNAGFVKKSDWFDDGQFGPNCIASKYL